MLGSRSSKSYLDSGIRIFFIVLFVSTRYSVSKRTHFYDSPGSDDELKQALDQFGQEIEDDYQISNDSEPSGEPVENETKETTIPAGGSIKNPKIGSNTTKVSKSTMPNQPRLGSADTNDSSSTRSKFKDPEANNSWTMFFILCILGN